MGRVRQRDTLPELAIQSVVRNLGYSLAANVKTLPGSPDLVDESRKLAILVHGCFWHRHKRCKAATSPTHNARFWKQKFLENERRDRLNLARLRRRGFGILTVWECQVKNPTKRARLIRRIARFLGGA
jgi:DNA mismatch endonuclease, patch repair protein